MNVMGVFPKITGSFVVLLSISACIHKSLESQANINPTGLADLLGTTYLWEYPDLAYEITFNSETEVFWKLSRGKFPGPTEGTDKIIHSQLRDGLLFVSWTEASGLGLYDILDFRTNQLITHGNHDGHMFVNPGTFKLKE